MKICLTLPRRVSVMNISHRLSYNLNTNLGEEVGYAISMDSKFSPKTKIMVMTDGILVR